MVDVVVTKKFKGGKEENRSSTNVSSNREIKNSIQIENILKNATTEATPKTFAICFDFKDQIDFIYKCQEDMFISEQVAENDTFADIYQIIEDEPVAYVAGTFLSQYEKLLIHPTAIGMVIIIGEFKL